MITQPDHAALAMRIMQHWVADDFRTSPRLDDILAAVAAHDDGWLEVDAAPLVHSETGELLDFISATDEIKQSVWPRAVDRLRRSPYQAALVAHHAVYVYGRNRSTPVWAPFFTQMEAIRDREIAAAPDATLEQLLRDYKFVRMGDLLSLAFCNQWTEVNADEQGYAIRFDGSRLTVTPDPFGGKEVPMQIAARRLPNRAFASTADAEEAWRSAPVVSVSAIAAGA
jgi:hypothetical protein